jgi:hypothetical protein
MTNNQFIALVLKHGQFAEKNGEYAGKFSAEGWADFEHEYKKNHW